LPRRQWAFMPLLFMVAVRKSMHEADWNEYWTSIKEMVGDWLANDGHIVEIVLGGAVK
jgi:hypothetical protein